MIANPASAIPIIGGLCGSASTPDGLTQDVPSHIEFAVLEPESGEPQESLADREAVAELSVNLEGPLNQNDAGCSPVPPEYAEKPRFNETGASSAGAVIGRWRVAARAAPSVGVELGAKGRNARVEDGPRQLAIADLARDLGGFLVRSAGRLVIPLGEVTPPSAPKARTRTASRTSAPGSDSARSSRVSLTFGEMTAPVPEAPERGGRA